MLYVLIMYDMSRWHWAGWRLKAGHGIMVRWSEKQ